VSVALSAPVKIVGPLAFETNKPIYILDQLREPAFAQKRNPFSCSYIASKGVSLRLSYVWSQPSNNSLYDKAAVGSSLKSQGGNCVPTHVRNSDFSIGYDTPHSGASRPFVRQYAPHHAPQRPDRLSDGLAQQTSRAFAIGRTPEVWRV
jgi:hypothetical protein